MFQTLGRHAHQARVAKRIVSSRNLCASSLPAAQILFVRTPTCGLSGTGDSQRDSRESVRANRSQLKPLFFIARQADSPESLEFPIRANHPIRAGADRANRFARITPLSMWVFPIFLLKSLNKKQFWALLAGTRGEASFCTQAGQRERERERGPDLLLPTQGPLHIEQEVRPVSFYGIARFKSVSESLRALRDILMSRGKSCLPSVSRQFLTRDYPHPIVS